ncbi:MAG: carboxymuconolactone decarboxylase family protein [Candidatus Marinimicrobia bacterium]|nr:carboxymuconolactone decarboxylase family protein [Candidatus Neomarinimicrobiota bacterium]
MSKQTKDAFNEERDNLNELVLKYSNKISKRFLNLDTQVYQDGALDSRTKEMMGLVASLVLRCDDCIKYHLIQCRNKGVANQELEEILSIALIVGGSITIPHIRRAVSFWDGIQ